MKNVIKKILVWTVYITTFGASITIFAGNLLYRFAIGRKKKSLRQQDDESHGWLEQNAKDVYITSEDGLKLHAYEIGTQEEGSKYVIICHGYKSRATQMSGEASRLHKEGFRVLVPDARGHGESEGNYIGMGWKERRDVIDWARRVVENDEHVQIVLYGVSMGAATVMMASGERDLPKEVKAIAEDCGYTSVWEEFKIQVRKMYHLPVYPFLPIARMITQIRAGYDFKEASAVTQVEKSITPTLFIHGDADRFVPYEMLDQLYEAAACEKEKLVIAGAQHAQSSVVGQERYWNAVLSFFGKYLSEQ